MNTKIGLEIEDGIASITLDDGKVNAMSTEMMAEISQALDTAEEANAVTVLKGREGIFSAGFDLKTFSRNAEAGLEMVRNGAILIEKLLAFPLPVLTVCTGHAYPMGAFLMLSADSRLGLEGSWKIGMNEVAIGLTVPMFAIELARHRLTSPGFVGINTATMFTPEQAVQHGYLDRVLPAEQLESATHEEALRLQALDMASFSATKARTNQKLLQSIGSALEADGLRQS